MIIKWFLLFVVSFVNVYAQSEGYIRLTGGSVSYLGRLEIFWKGQWGTFCAISNGGAQAACQQLGYHDVKTYLSIDKAQSKWNISKVSNHVPIAIAGTSCDRSWTKKFLHVLRCDYSTDVTSVCSHDTDIVIICENIPLCQYPYNSQVRLSFTTFPSQGTLEIYLNQQWGNICYSNFNQYAADTACRQMGYTNAIAITKTDIPTANVVWLNSVSCTSSCNCLNNCFKAPNSLTYQL